MNQIDLGSTHSSRTSRTLYSKLKTAVGSGDKQKLKIKVKNEKLSVVFSISVKIYALVRVLPAAEKMEAASVR
ncbi:hypothetical protein LJC08_05720 [Methanimicrococcus sp. OttesenSCG-928-J09]|nr:hypothetical protein [Methanimicrococcus sp. OttesenSCG-928-J09]